MNVILFGATGMVGYRLLRECLLDRGVDQILSIIRTPSGHGYHKPLLETPDIVRAAPTS